MKLITLTRGLSAQVDDEDFYAVSTSNWHAVPAGRKGRCGFYAVRRGREGEPSVVYMHRQLLGLVGSEIADHIDHDGLNNQRANLRRCDYTENLANTRRVNNVSGFRGVYPRRRGSTWSWQIQCRGQRILGPGYPTADAAARGYDAEARKLFGEFATLNFPAANDAEQIREVAA